MRIIAVSLMSGTSPQALPVFFTWLDCLAVLPVNLSQNRIALEAAAGDSVSASTFSTLTLSNIPRGSSLFW